MKKETIKTISLAILFYLSAFAIAFAISYPLTYFLPVEISVILGYTAAGLLLFYILGKYLDNNAQPVERP